MATNITDETVKIVKSDGTIGTTNKADTVTNWKTYYAGSPTDEIVTYGSSSDLWGETWTAEDINDVDFGVVLSADGVPSGNTLTGNIDHIRVTVYYTEATGNTGNIFLVM